jgi:N-acetylmuramoyl-L-alanine amidase
MRLKAIVFSCAASAILTLTFPLFSLKGVSDQSQSSIIKSITDKEKNLNNLNNIKDIISQIDGVYGDLFSKLEKGEKITIHFDPAHGRLPNGKWQGESTNRLSSTGVTEEFYSIQFARKFYKMLSNNKYLKVVSNDEYMRALKGETDEYKKIFFSETVRSAKEEKAFMVISEHLNNISVLQKTDGIINIPGIHVTCDDAGNKFLTYVHSTYDGYLTLYSKYDLSGFSKSIAYKMKEYIPIKGIKLNSWDYGAVADDRFSYFIDFPISVIFESGFISNPAEEAKLKDPDYQQKIIESQYMAVVESIDKIFGVDISGLWLRKTGDNTDVVDLIKISRIAIYYLQNDSPDKAVNVINEIEKNYYSYYPDLIDPYIALRERIIKAEKYFNKCVYQQKENKSREAKKNLLNAVKVTGNEQIFAGLTDKYSKYGKKHFGIKVVDFFRNGNSVKIPIPTAVERASLSTPVILAIEKDQTLEDAIIKSLSPNPETAVKLVKSFNDAFEWKKVKIEKYSEKKKKNIFYWDREKVKINFKEGLYLVKLDKKLQVTKAKRVTQLLLDPSMYQNHQYLKNSYFAGIKKEKSL